MRKCIFCQNQASTKEDAWPLWFMRSLPSKGYIDAERGGISLGAWLFNEPNLKIRCVCKTCNNGWMSRLENRVKPIVLGLIENSLKLISSDDQFVLSLWAVKNAMVFENLYPERPRFYKDEERHQLRIGNVIPPWTSAWISKCVNCLGPYTLGRDLRGPLSSGIGECHTYATTMAFGSLALQVASSHLPPAVPLSTILTPDFKKGPWPWDDITIQVWPTSTHKRVWPNKVGLNGVLGLDEFSKRFRVGTDDPVPRE